MSLAKTTGACPYCKEPIHPQAVKCKHCQSDLTAAKKQKRSYFARFNNFRSGFLAGVLFTLVMGILLYVQFFTD